MRFTTPTQGRAPLRRTAGLVAGIAGIAGVLSLLLLAGGGTARAHGAEGKMTVTKVEQVGPDQVRVEAGITYANDADLATEATVTATLTGPGGTTVGPTPLVREAPNSSLYAATVTVPAAGEWSVQVTSTGPAATASGSVSVTAPSTTASTAAPSTVVATSAPATTPSTTSAGSTPSTTTTGSSGDGGGSTGLVVVVVIAAVVVVGGVAFALNRRRSTS